jgi:hypothetical protein
MSGSTSAGDVAHLPFCLVDGSPMSRPPSPTQPKGYFSAPFERFVGDEAFEQLSSAFTLLGPSLFSALQ